MQATPPAASVCVAPSQVAAAPAARLPSGNMPRKATVKSPSTRPRMRSSTMVWMMVDTPIATVSALMPTTAIAASESASEVE